MKSTKDWDKIKTDLQFDEIDKEDLPKLLFDCIRDLLKSQEETKHILEEIESFQTKVKEYDHPWLK